MHFQFDQCLAQLIVCTVYSETVCIYLPVHPVLPLSLFHSCCYPMHPLPHSCSPASMALCPRSVFIREWDFETVSVVAVACSVRILLNAVRESSICFLSSGVDRSLWIFWRLLPPVVVWMARLPCFVFIVLHYMFLVSVSLRSANFKPHKGSLSC